MFMSFNPSVGKMIGTTVKTFVNTELELFKTIFMEGCHFLFQYHHNDLYAFIHRFTENEISLEMKVRVIDPFYIFNGYFVAGSGRFKGQEQTIFACATDSDTDACFYIVSGQFKRTRSPKPTPNYMRGMLTLMDGISAITTLDGSFVRLC